ncbi:endolytic transglycosylase MltG [Enterococcus pallens]|uniref:Endolytic murein transglycosylase n=1 Tax=Enterococcus pallens ATCC BAA-351 TaxID=1158607 RepID=R2PT65_9ENTE|nr:endolytic transglycosylase MltG [Enterococcus pallens]EOH87782.1 aminodeoxychorismate lyase [Enterococcus pallens ATCC BAA-351]EOU17996.1 aminodeoxychorismate lyase [Enterococcus pallens ATCC BAA-351]
MSDVQNTHSEEGSFKEQIMRALEENRQKRETEQGEESIQKIERPYAPKQEPIIKEKKQPSTKKEASTNSKKIEEQAAVPAIIEEVDEPTIFEKLSDKIEEIRQIDYDEYEEELSEESNLKRAERRKEDRVVRKIVYVLTVAILIIAGILAISGYNYVSAGLKPLDTNDKKLVQVEIPSGSSNRQIGEILEKDDVIRDGLVFNFYTKFKNLTNFQAGYYQFSPNMTLDQIGKELQQGGSDVPLDDASKLTIPEGYDVDQIGTLVAKKTDFSKEDFLKLMNDDAFFNQLKEQYPDLLTDAGSAEGVKYRLEGYLFPATYNVLKTNNLQELVTQMVDATNQVMAPYYSRIKEKGMTVQEVMTLASLVEKEGVTTEDRKKIAQVFFNRIDEGMPLQSDISILYALGEHKEVVSYKDTEIDSPYNLYVNTGYGPGPFDSPSQDAILAVLEPTANDYYYFVADISTGKVYYAKTYDEHMELVEKYVNKD